MSNPPLIELTPATSAVSTLRQALLRRRIRLLAGATITYNVIEAIVAITAGTIASSTALIGFGLDSVVEVASAGAAAWQFSAKDPHSREKLTLPIIALSFFALCRLRVRRVGAGAAGSSRSPPFTGRYRPCRAELGSPPCAVLGATSSRA